MSITGAVDAKIVEYENFVHKELNVLPPLTKETLRLKIITKRDEIRNQPDGQLSRQTKLGIFDGVLYNELWRKPDDLLARRQSGELDEFFL